MAVAVIDKVAIVQGLVDTGAKVRVRRDVDDEGNALGPDVVGELSTDEQGRLWVFDTDNDPAIAQPGTRFQLENVQAIINDRFVPIIQLTEKLEF